MTHLINSLPIARFVVIGSYPLGVRLPKDIDVVCYKEDVECEFIERDKFSGHFDFEGRRIELLFANEQESFQSLLAKYPDTKRFATTSELHAIKKAHIIFPHKNWEKHMEDLCYLTKLMSYMGSEPLTDLIKLHRKSTEYRIGKQKTPKLNGVSKEQFFDDKVIKFYDHDDIHQLFAHREKPMYTYMQRDESLVQCDKDLWLQFPHIDKLRCVMEEAYVIASERHIIPTLKGVSVGLPPEKAFQWALMRICTTLCSGWFRNFAIENYMQVLNNYNKEFYFKLPELDKMK